MGSPFGIEVALAGLGTAEVAQGLDRMSDPPEWLTAIEDPRRLRDDLERSIPELASGAQRLLSCKFKRAHINASGWQTLCRLTVDDAEGGTPRQVDVYGHLAAPGVDVAPTVIDGYRFGTNHRYHLPDVQLAPGQRAPDETFLPWPYWPTRTRPDRCWNMRFARTGATLPICD